MTVVPMTIIFVCLFAMLLSGIVLTVKSIITYKEVKKICDELVNSHLGNYDDPYDDSWYWDALEDLHNWREERKKGI